MKIFIASDHGGFDLKQRIIETLTDYEIKDLGPYGLDPEDDYPPYAFKVAEKVIEDKDDLGILICRSGNGMSIAANKVKGSYAALCFSKIHAMKAREDDNANICVLDADYEGDDPIEIVKAFITTEFEGMDSRHGRRFKMIQEYENKE